MTAGTASTTATIATDDVVVVIVTIAFITVILFFSQRFFRSHFTLELAFALILTNGSGRRRQKWFRMVTCLPS